MNDSMAQPGHALAPLELSGWKSAVSWTAAIIIALLFLVSGIWKITDAPGAAVRMAQAKVPQSLSLAAAVGFGIVETVTGVLILLPRFRRWGAWLASALLVAFLIYFAIHYNALRGEECSCFPWVKRVVGPGFFIGDAIMLLLAAAAGVWTQPSHGRRTAALIVAAVSVFAAVSYGVEITRSTGAKAPASITVDGKPFSLQEGKVFLYYFDPECMHCLDAARRMAKYNWGDTKVVAVATQNPQFSQQFLQMTGLRASLSNDLALLKQSFPFSSTPAATAVENGRQKAQLTKFEDDEPAATLKDLGFIY